MLNASQLTALGSGLQNVGLALMVGGMLAIGAFCAPVIFKHFPRHEAGAALTVIFMRFDKVLLGALVLMLMGEALRFCSQQFVWQTPLGYLRLALMLVLAGLMLFATLKVNPSIATMQSRGISPNATPEGIQFAKTHQLSESLYKAQMLLALGLLLLTPWVGTKQ